MPIIVEGAVYVSFLYLNYCSVHFLRGAEICVCEVWKGKAGGVTTHMDIQRKQTNAKHSENIHIFLWRHTQDPALNSHALFILEQCQWPCKSFQTIRFQQSHQTKWSQNQWCAPEMWSQPPDIKPTLISIYMFWTGPTSGLPAPWDSVWLCWSSGGLVMLYPLKFSCGRKALLEERCQGNEIRSCCSEHGDQRWDFLHVNQTCLFKLDLRKTAYCTHPAMHTRFCTFKQLSSLGDNLPWAEN